MSAIRLSRNYKVPVVYGNPSGKIKTVYRWDPASRRTIPVQCLSCYAPAPAPAPPPTIDYQYVYISGSVGVDPGAGNFSANVTVFPTVVLQFNKTDKNAQDATSFLNQITTASTIVITKDPSNYSTATINSFVIFPTYYQFTCTVGPFAGVVSPGDTVTITYT
jgi:hypothetical protein